MGAASFVAAIHRAPPVEKFLLDHLAQLVGKSFQLSSH